MSTVANPSSGPAATSSALRDDAAVIGLVGMAHLISHYSQLLLAPLFPWLKTEFNVSYAELGFLLSVFFVVSCAVQAMSGFVVDRFGPRPALFAGLGLLGMAAIGFATSTHYLTLLVFAAVAGVGNGVFHPVDYTILNRKVSAARLGHAYSVHGITGSLGWALAPAMLVPLAAAFGWRVALLAAAGLIFTVLAIVFWRRRVLELPPAPHVAQHASQPAESAFGFLRIPAVWMCFAFFFFYAAVLSVIQTFATSSATHLTNVPATLAAMCLTAYMVASAGGMVLVDGFIATAAALCALRARPEAAGYTIFSHRSKEPGHRAVLDALDAKPLLDLDLRLGEGTGALLAFPLLRNACAMFNDMATFESAGVSGKE